ncbi:hypothetical protein P7K49_004408 [Saguinus oedipus]|uniref:Uncharacterized protein n=1 Tax=Saguinus oedipus TaxID=9490 RepID=A0ABQ9W7B4_SAGOE|nr:hypothetical protein P7K49_004408 [Saguinus oedipus]
MREEVHEENTSRRGRGRAWSNKGKGLPGEAGLMATAHGGGTRTADGCIRGTASAMSVVLLMIWWSLPGCEVAERAGGQGVAQCHRGQFFGNNVNDQEVTLEKMQASHSQ